MTFLDQQHELPARVRLNKLRTLLQETTDQTWPARRVVEFLAENHIPLVVTQGQPNRDFTAVGPEYGTAAVSRDDALNVLNFASATAGPEAA